MTALEWQESIGDFDDLIQWCYDNEMCESYIENIISDNRLDEYVEDDVTDRWCGWRDLRDSLADIPTGYDWYIRNGSFDYDGLSDYDFEEYKRDVFNELDDRGFFDDEEEEEDDDEPFECQDYKAASAATEPEYEMAEFSGDILNAMISCAYSSIAQVDCAEDEDSSVPEQDVNVEESLEEDDLFSDEALEFQISLMQLFL